MTLPPLMRTLSCMALAGAALALSGHDSFAQQLVQGYTYNETASQQPGNNNLVFGVAIYQLCMLKNYLFMGVYILAAIAFVFFAAKALFTKFEFRAFFPILGAIFVVAFADLFIAFIAPNAWYCPTTLSQL